MAVYLDCNATTPIEPEVLEIVNYYLEQEFGNAGSRTHEYGTRAKQAINKARGQIAKVIKCDPLEVIFTSGATESNNIAIMGLEQYGRESGKLKVITTPIEHKAVIGPTSELKRRGFKVFHFPVGKDGIVVADALADMLTDDTLLVSVMHANNETGVLQPIHRIAEIMQNCSAYFHVDAAQGFGKELSLLTDSRIDMISISGHKIFAPKGVGALVVRRRNSEWIPLRPLMFGGGQERNLRPGTLPVALIAGLGAAAELAVRDHTIRLQRVLSMRKAMLIALERVGACFHGDQAKTLPHVLNFRIPGVDSEAAILSLKHVVAVSNGSACTSQSYNPSHVLLAMQLGAEEATQAIRFSWSHLTNEPDYEELVVSLRAL
jgi:cysteine desulfurase